MLDYADWVRRAVTFTEKLPDLPGEVRVQIEVAPPLSEEAVHNLARACRLPIPEPLQRFWKEASGHCLCTYWWDTPERFHPQMAVTFPDWSLSHIWGGPQFDSAPDIINGTESCLDWSDSFRNEFPKDARYWEHSLPIIPVGNGDYAGMYVRDNPDDPPVVFLCHDGYGASGVIAPDFDTFLTLWEQLGYVGIQFLSSFINPRTGLLDPSALATEAAAVRALLRGAVRSGLVKTPLGMPECEWATCADPDIMLKWLEKNGRLDRRKLRLFACACCRRVWDRMGLWSRRAVEVAERFADGLASEDELQAARAALIGGEQGSQVLQEMSIPPDTPFPDVGADGSQRFMAAIRESVEFSRAQGLMHRAAFAAVDGDARISWEIIQHLDEPELLRERTAHADLIRHFFGNPCR